MMTNRLITTMAVASAVTIFSGLVVLMSPGTSSALTTMEIAAPKIPAPVPTPTPTITQAYIPTDAESLAQTKRLAALDRPTPTPTYASPLPTPTHTTPTPSYTAPAPAQVITPTVMPTTPAPEPSDTSTPSPSPTPTTTVTPTPTPTHTSTGDLGAEILNKALTMEGVPYVYGGDTPSGFDCSGLIYWAALQLGIDSMPRDTYEMLSQGVSSGLLVETSSPSYGDLAFFGSGHVELYVKDGETFGAHHTGTDVGYAPYGPGYGPTMFYRVT